MTNGVTAWSYSRYADYELCPAKFKYKVLDRLPDPGSPAMQRGNDIHKMAENFVGVAPTARLTKVPPELRNFESEFKQLREMGDGVMVEQEWGFRNDWTHTGRKGWFGDDVWFRAKADVALVYEDNTGEVIDHKTGRKYETNVDQVGLMAVAAWRRFPQLTHVTARLWYLDVADPNEKEVIVEFTIPELTALQRDWTKKVVPMFLDKKFAPRPNNKCGWCPYSRAKGGPCKF